MEIEFVVSTENNASKKSYNSSEDYRKELIRRLARVKSIAGNKIYRYVLNTVRSYTDYFKANWNCSFDSPDYTLSVDFRTWTVDPKDVEARYEDDVNDDRFVEFIPGYSESENICVKDIYISNGTWYGKWLLDGTMNTMSVRSYMEPGLEDAQDYQMADNNHPFDFMVGAEEYIQKYNWDRQLSVIRTEQKNSGMTRTR